MSLFSTSAFELGFALVTAHLVGDYVLQTDRMAQSKYRWSILLAHGLPQGGVAYGLAGGGGRGVSGRGEVYLSFR